MATKGSVFWPRVKQARVLALSWHSRSAAHGGKAAARHVYYFCKFHLIRYSVVVLCLHLRILCGHPRGAHYCDMADKDHNETHKPTEMATSEGDGMSRMVKGKGKW